MINERKVTPTQNINISGKDLQISQLDKKHKAWKVWFVHKFCFQKGSTFCL